MQNGRRRARHLMTPMPRHRNPKMIDEQNSAVVLPGSKSNQGIRQGLIQPHMMEPEYWN